MFVIDTSILTDAIQSNVSSLKPLNHEVKMFSTWCLRNFLFGLLIIALILSVLQVILIFMNNMIFGAVLMVAYIIFFQVFIFALCRDSITLFFATLVFLFIFVIGCICIQSTKTEITQIFVYNQEEKAKTSLLSASFVDLASECCGAGDGNSVERLRRCCHNDTFLGDPTSSKCQQMDLGRFFFTRGCARFQISSRDRSVYDRLNMVDPLDSPNAPELPRPPEEVDDDEEYVRSGRQEASPKPEEDKKPEKRPRFVNELRWISNVLGIMHILMIALIFCYLYELLFGYCDHPYTYC